MGANPLAVRRTSHAAPSVRRREPNSLVAAVRDELSRCRSTAVVTASASGAGPEAVVVRDAHGPEPAGPLSAHSSSASLLVVGASSRRDAHELLGETTRRMLGRTRCPLAVVPTAPPGFPHGLRRPAHTSGTLAPDRRSRSGRV
jgi:nucleotide-binding universal stress UspA family protein